MHELGVTFKVLDMTEETAAENGMTKVDEVVIELGEVSAVIPSYLKNCWKWAVKKRGEAVRNAALSIEAIPAVSTCEDCGADFGTVAYGKKCPVCGGENTYLIRGNEFLIKEIRGE